MSSRDIVFGRIAKALNRHDQAELPGVQDQPAQVRDRILGHARSTLPAIRGDATDVLIDRMEAVLISVVRLQTIGDCVAAADAYLESQGIDTGESGCVTVSPDLADLAWPSSYESGRATGKEKVSITPCVAAVAETGSIVTHSGPGTPATLNIVPETHIIVVHESQVVRHVEDVFGQLREADGLPRAVNFVTGPSRTADIEQTL